MQLPSSAYLLEMFPAGADPTSRKPSGYSRSWKAGDRPTVRCRVDIASTILALSPGNYVATVTAFGSGGSTQSAASPQFTR